MSWMKRPDGIGNNGDRAPTLTPAASQPLAVPVEYQSLPKYLRDRYADIVVLTFAQIEDLLGFALPDLASVRQEWWMNPGAASAPSDQSRSWTQACRTATPNLPARIVMFERASGDGRR